MNSQPNITSNLTNQSAREAAFLTMLEEQRLRHGSHEIAAIWNLCYRAFVDSGDPDVGMKFIGIHWSWFEVTTFLRPILEAATASKPETLNRHRAAFMSAEERAAFDALPTTLTIFRGGGRSTILEGVSWSTSRETAGRFAKMACSLRRHLFRLGQRDPVVVEATVPRDACFAVKLGRDEDEIIVAPGDHIAVRQVTAIDWKDELLAALC